MLKKILLATVVVVNVANATEVKESGIVDVSSNTKSSGWYAGVGAGIVNWGGSFEVDNGISTTTHNGDVKDSPVLLKMGYITESENRVEVYYKKDSIDTKGGDRVREGEMYEISTFGLNYQWGISSLSSEKVLPYIRLGLGFGSSTSNYVEAKDGTVVELDLALGVYSEVATNIDVSAGIYRRAIVTVAENPDIFSDDYITGAATNGIEIGLNYHF